MKPKAEPPRQPAAPQDSDKPSRVGMLWFAIAGILLAYPLTLGPVLRCSKDPPKVIQVFYEPLLWTLRNSPPEGFEALTWYIQEVWGVH